MEGRNTGVTGLWGKQRVPVPMDLISGRTDAPRAPWRRRRERLGEKEEVKDEEEDARKRASVHGEQLEEFWQILGREIV